MGPVCEGQLQFIMRYHAHHLIIAGINLYHRKCHSSLCAWVQEPVVSQTPEGASDSAAFKSLMDIPLCRACCPENIGTVPPGLDNLYNHDETDPRREERETKILETFPRREERDIEILETFPRHQ